MFKRVLLSAVLICMTVSAGAELLSSHRSNIAGISRVDFLYEVVDALPETDQNIVFGLLHTDEFLYEKFAQFQGRSEVFASSSPVIKKWLGVINQRIKAAQVSRVLKDEIFFKFMVSSTDESFVVGFRLEKRTVRSVPQLFAFVTIYGFEKEVPAYLLNFLQSCFLEKTMVQKHSGKFLLAGVGLTFGAYSKRVPLMAGGRKVFRNFQSRYFGRRAPLVVIPQGQQGDFRSYQTGVFLRRESHLPPFAGPFQPFTPEVFAVIKTFIMSRLTVCCIDHANCKTDQTLNQNVLLKELHSLILDRGGIYELFENLKNETAMNRDVRTLFLAQDGIYAKIAEKAQMQSIMREAYVKTMIHLLSDKREQARAANLTLPVEVVILPN